nr:hypothetical protein [Tanacetum cinerariifolium]
MAIRDFKKFFKRRGRFVRQPQNDKKTFQRNRDDKNGKSDRKCFRCGNPNHLIGECPNPPKYKNQRAFIEGTNPDSNVITSTFLLNNCYASILFDIGADRSFLSTAFSSEINITPTTLDHYYDVKLADGRIFSEKKPYGGSKPLCSKCNYHHDGLCAPKCHKCNRVGHLARHYRSPTNANTANNQKGTGASQKATCFECGAQGYFKRECPKLKYNNRSNQGGNGNAPAKVYVVGNAGTNPDSNVITSTFLLNNCYASILFDIGADRSFLSTAFSSEINITPTTLDHYYGVKLADGRIFSCHCLCRETRSYSLGKRNVDYSCDGRDQGNETRLDIISYTKTQKYMLKGCHVFLAHVTTKKAEEKSKEKRLEDVPIV